MKATLTVVAVTMVGAALTAQRVGPMRTLRLPDTAYEYANVPLPAHFQGARAVDNTPADHPITNDGATLGRVLFYDTALSANGTTSCSSCHRQQHAFADPRAQEATDVMVRLLRNHDAYEANQFEENNAFLVAASIFPYFYALVGERNPKQAPRPKPHSEYSQLACDAFELISRAGPISKQKMREDLGGSISFVALDHALGEARSDRKIAKAATCHRLSSSPSKHPGV